MLLYILGYRCPLNFKPPCMFEKFHDKVLSEDVESDIYALVNLEVTTPIRNRSVSTCLHLMLLHVCVSICVLRTGGGWVTRTLSLPYILPSRGGRHGNNWLTWLWWLSSSRTELHAEPQICRAERHSLPSLLYHARLASRRQSSDRRRSTSFPTPQKPFPDPELFLVWLYCDFHLCRQRWDGEL